MKSGQEKYQRLFCQKGENKGNQHERGEWRLLEDNGVYKVMGKFCKYCDLKLGEEVMK